MPSPKSGKAGSLVCPAAPREAKEADVADPGEAEKGKSGQSQSTTGKSGSPAKKSHVGSKTSKADDDADSDGKKKVWIEIELVDKDNKPVPGEAYQVTLPDGETVAEGTLDEKGLARVDGIDPGSCKITFPNLEKQAWKPL